MTREDRSFRSLGGFGRPDSVLQGRLAGPRPPPDTLLLARGALLAFHGAPCRLAGEALSSWLMWQNPRAGTPERLWPTRVNLLNSSFSTSLLHFKEQPQLEQLGLDGRGECFRSSAGFPQ